MRSTHVGKHFSTLTKIGAALLMFGNCGKCSKPTEEELFQMISEVDEDMSGAIDFAEFLQVIDNQKDRAAMFEDDSDMIDAFVACGGKPDKTGFVRKETLVKIVKTDFGLTINIEEMINKLDVNGSGEIEFEEFKAILT
ncbi:putative flagellar calcium-binding protein calflagin [Plasmopara halstedii]